jgi:LPS export ABC transporter protein LptC
MQPRFTSLARTTGLALALIMAFGCGHRRAVGPTGSSGELPDQEVSDFVLTETDQGNPQWTLYATYAATYSTRSTITARGVRVDFFDNTGKQSSELTAREGDINQLTRDMTARGNVVLQNVDGTRMTTEHLKFLNQAQKIVTDDFVRVQRSGDELTGVGFESDPQLKHFEFKTKVNATVRTNSGGLIESGGHK